MVGTIFEEIPIKYQDIRDSKHSSYEKIKRGKSLLWKIQARGEVDIPEKVYEAIKKQIKLKQITDVRKITCELIRNCLRKTKYTKYNEYIPYIRVKLTNESSPQLPETEEKKTLYYLEKILNKHNLPYYAYFLYKVLELILNDENEESLLRKKKIFSNIHMQSKSIIKERDKLWKTICDEIPEFKYTPTDRFKYKIQI